MGLFDFFKRKPPRLEGAELRDADLRDALIAAAERRDGSLSRLCDDYARPIHEAFPQWSTVPQEFRVDPIERDRYCEGLIAVASHFEMKGDRSLIDLMMHRPGGNPLVQWEEDLVAGQASIDEGKPHEAIQRLVATLERTKELRGPGVDHFLPRTLGMLGVAHYHAGNLERAIDLTKRAKMRCEETGDAEGVRVYAGNLAHMGVGETAE